MMRLNIDDDALFFPTTNRIQGLLWKAPLSKEEREGGKKTKSDAGLVCVCVCARARACVKGGVIYNLCMYIVLLVLFVF